MKILSFLILPFLVFVCNFNLIASQGESRIDSLKKRLSGTNNRIEKVDLLNKLVKEYLKLGIEDSAQEYLQRSISAAVKARYKKGEADALQAFGRYELTTDKQLDKSTYHFLKSLAIYDSLGDKEGISQCHLQLGVISYDLQNYGEALESFRESINYKPDKSPLSGTGHYLMALCYSEMDSIPQAIYYFDIALKEYRRSGNQTGVFQCNTFIGKMYTNMGEYHKAIIQLEQSIDSARMLGDSTILLPPFAFLSTAYLKAGNDLSAIYYGNKAIRVAKDMRGTTMYIKEAMTSLHLAYKNTGKVDKAYYFLNELNTLKDSIYGNSILQRISELRGKFVFAQQLNESKAEQAIKDALAGKEIQKQKLLRNGFLGGFSIVFLFAIVFFFQRKKIFKGKQRSDELLLNILPAQVAEELKQKGRADAQQFDSVTVMFTDFKNFTGISEKLSAAQLVDEIDMYYKAFDQMIAKYNVEKIKTIGDSYMCAGGLPVANATHAVDVINFALELQDYMQKVSSACEQAVTTPFEIRIGIHTGPVVAGIVGIKKFAYDIWGDTVNIASRLENSGEAGKINISGATHALVKDHYTCTYRGKIEAKNKGMVDMYFVENKKAKMFYHSGS